MKVLAVMLLLAWGSTPRVVKVEKAPDGRSDAGVVVMTDDKAPAAPRGWLGVSLGNVPEALATQLDVNGGVLILNVVEGSPADEAGFEPHDILVSVRDEEAGDDVNDIVKIIGAGRPGDTVNFVVLRDGEEKRISATLGDRPAREPRALAWKIEGAPDAEVEDQIRTRGRFLFKGPKGHWVMRDLGDVADMDLPEDVLTMLPDAESRSVQVFVEDGEKRVRTQVQRDGQTITVEREGDDQITVSRTDAQGNETSATYESEEELQESDEEAHELLHGSGGGMFQIKLDGLNGEDFDFDFDFDVDADVDWHGAFDVEQLHESLQHAQEAYKHALEQFHQLQGNSGNGEPTPFFFHHGGDAPKIMALRGKPRQTFEVRPDGTIEVRVRKGDSELVKLYENEDQLRKKEPELYEKYRDLMDADE